MTAKQTTGAEKPGRDQRPDERTLLRVLMVEDDESDAQFLQSSVAEELNDGCSFHHVRDLAHALEALGNQDFHAILLDLNLPDSKGGETYYRVHKDSPDIPIVILTGNADESLALKCVGGGAQDYLVKGDATAGTVLRALRFGIERQRILNEIRAASLVDELTGLYNRSGFIRLGEQQFKLAQRSNKGIVLLFADIDNMTWINDTYGHPEGDMTLQVAGDLLRQCFRQSDVVARVGGDEFAVMAIGSAKKDNEVLAQRIAARIDQYNALNERPHALQVSFGMTYFDPVKPRSMEDILAEADMIMYDQKRNKKRAC